MKPSLRQQVADLNDQFQNGLRYNKKRNLYELVWTKRELSNAKRRATRLCKKLGIPTMRSTPTGRRR